MKVYLTALLIVIIGKSAIAQTDSLKSNTTIHICAPSKHQVLNPPLVMVMSHSKTFIIADSNLNIINPSWIKTINVLKGDNAIKNYGEAGKNGVIEITINDEKYPDAYQSIQKDDIKNSNQP